MRYFRRVAKSTRRVTFGKIYPIDDEGKAIDNDGNPISLQIGYSNYWKEVAKIEWLNQQDIDLFPKSPKSCNPLMINQQESKPMRTLTIETITFVNGTDVKKLNQEQLIQLVVAEEEKKADLEKLPKSLRNTSKAIQHLITKHNNNIQWLINRLDETAATE